MFDANCCFLCKSPTSFNIQNWRFVLIRDAELRKQIREAAVDQAQVTDASLLFLLTADLKAWPEASTLFLIMP